MAVDLEDFNVLHQYMSRCVELGRLAPNHLKKPYVGALVLRKDGKVLGEGYRKFIDGTKMVCHAERVAIDKTGFYDLKGTYLFTTLEPCVWVNGDERGNGRKRKQIIEPCSKLIVDEGIETVVFSELDNSFTMSPGTGVNYLKDHGVKVIQYEGLSREILSKLMTYECRINRGLPG